MSKKWLFFSLLLALNFTSALTQSTDSWTRKYDQDGITIWTQGAKTSAYKATVTVDAGIEACVALLQDINEHPRFMGSVKSAKLVKLYNQKESLVYFVIDMPFPMKDMDLVSKASFNYLPKENKVVVGITAQPEKLPVSSYERMQKADGFWSFQRLKNGKTEVTYQLAFEPSNAPNWIVDYFLLDNPKKIMKGFSLLVTQNKYKDQDIAWIN